MSAVPTIQTERLCLQAFSDADLSFVYTGLSDPDVIRYYGVSYDSLDSAKKQMEWFETIQQNDTGVWWRIHRLDTGQPIGGIGLHDIDLVPKNAELGFWLIPQAWGKGYIHECLPRVAQCAREKFNLSSLIAIVERQNAKSESVLLRHQFKLVPSLASTEMKNNSLIMLDAYQLFL